MTHLLSSLPPDLYHLAQLPPAIQNIGSNLGTDLGSSLINLGKALIILIIGWIISNIVKSIIKKILNSTDIDNRIASAVTGQRGGDSFPIEEWIATAVCWIIRLFVIMAFLNALNLQSVSAPLNSLLTQVTSFIPQIFGAAILLGIAWIVATIVRTIATRSLGAFNLDRKLGNDASGFDISDTIGNALYWFVFLLFLPAILGTLELNGILTPIQGMLNELLAMLPNILGAVILGAVGWFVSKIVSSIVTNLLAATGVDSIGEKVGLKATGGQKPLSGIIGTVVFVLILIPFAISALEALKIAAISDPATDMLNQVFDLLPKLFSAGIVLALFFAAGKFVSELVVNILTSVGFNNFLDWIGISVGQEQGNVDRPLGETEQATVLQSDSLSAKTPSEYVGLAALVAIMLTGTLTAVNILGIPALESVISVIMTIAGQVFVGVLVFGIGLYFANMAHKLIQGTGMAQAGLLAQSARIAIIVLVGAMALDRIGVAPNIVNLAFGLILGGIAVAIALAFGLGGREVAKESLRSWVNGLKQD